MRANGTGSQTTDTVLWEDTAVTAYVGAIALADQVITLDSTAGHHDLASPDVFGHGPGYYSHEELPRQTLRFGYSYDAATDTLYANNVVCTEPLRFVRNQH